MPRQRERYPGYVDDLADLPVAARDTLSVALGPSGVVSYYGDAIWEFRPYVRTRNTKPAQKRIDFYSLQFADGSRLTDSQHAELLNTTKAFLYVRLAHKHPRSGKVLKHQTVVVLWKNLRPLLRWMVAEGHLRFADLTPTACRAYLDACECEGLKFAGLYSRIAVLECLHVFREHLADRLPQHPWRGASADLLAGYSGQRHAQYRGMTPRIPDRILRELAQGALRYVESDYGEQLLACRDTRMAERPLDDHLSALGMEGWGAVRDEITRLYTACYVVIALFSGLRDSEMTSLEPACYLEREGWDGATYGWIKGMTYKTEADPKSVEWMVPPVVAMAAALAERVSAPIRGDLEAKIAELEERLVSASYLSEKQRARDIELLDESRLHRTSLFLAKSDRHGTISTWTSSTTRYRLAELARQLNLRVEAADLSEVRNKDIGPGDLWPLAPHQFRKTFAVYVARNVLGDVRYLREHYKHWSLDMTLYYAAADLDYVDETLLDEVLSERDELQVILIEGWIATDKPLAGAGAQTIKEWRERNKEVRVAEAPNDLARKLSSGFYIRGTGHSWCTSENCKGAGLYNVLECKDCKNRLIDQTHLTVWRGIRRQQIELLQMDDLGDPMWQRAKDHLRYAEQILGELNEEVEPYPIPLKPSERRAGKFPS